MAGRSGEVKLRKSGRNDAQNEGVLEISPALKEPSDRLKSVDVLCFPAIDFVH